MSTRFSLLESAERVKLATDKVEEILHDEPWVENGVSRREVTKTRGSELWSRGKPVYLAEHWYITRGLLGKAATSSLILCEADFSAELGMSLNTDYRYLPYRDKMFVCGVSLHRDAEGNIVQNDEEEALGASPEQMDRFWYLLADAKK